MNREWFAVRFCIDLGYFSQALFLCLNPDPSYASLVAGMPTHAIIKSLETLNIVISKTLVV